MSDSKESEVVQNASGTQAQTPRKEKNCHAMSKRRTHTHAKETGQQCERFGSTTLISHSTGKRKWMLCLLCTYLKREKVVEDEPKPLMITFDQTFIWLR